MYLNQAPVLQLSLNQPLILRLPKIEWRQILLQKSHSHLLDENESVPVEPGLGPVCEFEKFPRSAPLKHPMIGDGITRHDLGTEKSMKFQSTVGHTSSIKQPEVTSHVAFKESQNSRTAATQYPQNKSKEMFMT